MSDKEMIEKYKQFEYILHLDYGWMIQDFIRLVGGGLINLLVFLNNMIESVVDKVISLNDFYATGPMKDFMDLTRPIVWGLFTIALIVVGIQFMLNKIEKRNEVFLNVILAVCVIVVIPDLMSNMGKLTKAGIEQINPEKNSLAAEMVKSNVADVLYYAENGFVGASGKGSPGSPPLPQNKSNSSVGTTDFTHANRLTEDVLAYLPYAQKLDFHEAEGWFSWTTEDWVKDLNEDSKDFLKNRMVAKGVGSEFMVEELDKNAIKMTKIGRQSYYRYHVNWGVLIFSLFITTVALTVTVVRVGRNVFDLAFHQIFGMFIAATDLTGGQRTKKVLVEIMNTFAVIFIMMMLLKMFIIYSTWANGLKGDIGSIGVILMLIAGAWALIDAPEIVTRMLGIDAGIRSGYGAMMGSLAAAKMAGGVASAVGKGAKAGVSGALGAGNFAKQTVAGMGTKTPKESAATKEKVKGMPGSGSLKDSTDDLPIGPNDDGTNDGLLPDSPSSKDSPNGESDGDDSTNMIQNQEQNNGDGSENQSFEGENKVDVEAMPGNSQLTEENMVVGAKDSGEAKQDIDKIPDKNSGNTANETSKSSGEKSSSGGTKVAVIPIPDSPSTNTTSSTSEPNVVGGGHEKKDVVDIPSDNGQTEKQVGRNSEVSNPQQAKEGQQIPVDTPKKDVKKIPSESDTKTTGSGTSTDPIQFDQGKESAKKVPEQSINNDAEKTKQDNIPVDKDSTKQGSNNEGQQTASVEHGRADNLIPSTPQETTPVVPTQSSGSGSAGERQVETPVMPTQSTGSGNSDGQQVTTPVVPTQSSGSGGAGERQVETLVMPNQSTGSGNSGGPQVTTSVVPTSSSYGAQEQQTTTVQVQNNEDIEFVEQSPSSGGNRQVQHTNTIVGGNKTVQEVKENVNRAGNSGYNMGQNIRKAARGAGKASMVTARAVRNPKAAIQRGTEEGRRGLFKVKDGVNNVTSNTKKSFGSVVDEINRPIGGKVNDREEESD